MSNASRSTVALPYSQPHSHTTSPTYSAGASPPSRPFSPTSLPRAPEPQSLEFSTLLRARSTPPLSRALSSPPSPYSPPLTSRPFPLPTSPPIDSRIDASQISISDTADSITESTNSPLLSAAEFFDLDAQEPQDVLVRSPSPPTGLVSASSGSTVFAARSVMAPVEVETHTRRNWEDAFRIASFSQGCLLEEHSTVADLRIRPGELLEIQRVNAAVHLSRPTYTQPYFEAPVYLIKRTPMHYTRPQTSHHPHPLIPAARPHQHHIQPMRDYAPPIPEINPPMSPIEATTRVRSRTVTARDAYDNVSEKWDDDGEQEWAELELSGLEGIGESNGRARPVNENPVRNEGDKIEWKVRWLTLREGMFSLSRSRSKQAQPLFSRPVSSVLTAQQLPAVPSMGHLPRNYISIHFTGISRKERERERDCDIGIRMMDGAAHAHLFRVLLRIINTPGTHTFLHTDTPYFASPPLPSQYPEWRQYIVQRAWLAGRATSIMHGLTVAGPWMRSPWLAWTDNEAESFPDDDTSQYGDEYETDSDDASQLYESQIGAMEGFDQQRDSDSEVEWDVEGWRAWESENAFGSWTSSAVWLKHRVDAGGRPRSRSLAAPSSRSSSMNQPREPPNSTYPYPSQHPELLSPVSTSSDISTTSPNTRRARSSTIAVPSQPESPTGSPPTWSPTLGQRRPLTSGAGIETVLRTPTASQSRRSELDRRGSTNSLEMQRAHPPSSRRAVTSPPPGAKFP